ncbi:histidine phosphatase family protein [Celeribacter sp.]|uniref:histidine phosphatase family protein n=1 Tax=Celeribacter sp. TaxID=1890673 RepID=UPI003A8E12DA
MNHLYLVRHGPTHAKSFVGWTDVPADLSETDKIARLEAALPHAPIISSDLSRAVKTADAIQGARPRLPHDPRLRETYFGAWEGLTWAQIEAQDGALARKVFETPGDTAPPEGESWNTLSARVASAVDALTGDVIVVAHMGVIMSLLQKALNCPPFEALGHEIAPLSLTVIRRKADWKTGGWNALSINHFPE